MKKKYPPPAPTAFTADPHPTEKAYFALKTELWKKTDTVKNSVTIY